MSQSGQRPASANSSFPLLKFSKATDPAPATQFSWVHYMNHDIHIFFDSYGSSGSTPAMMKVIQGAQVLELLNLAELVEGTNAAIENARHHRIELRRGQYPFSALYRRMNCVIALQYQIPDHKIRRIQLRFTSVQDFDTALAILQALGCPLYSSNPDVNPSSRPSTANAQTTGPSPSTNSSNSNENLVQASIYRPSLLTGQPRPQTAFEPNNFAYLETSHINDRPTSSSSSFFSAQEHTHRPSSLSSPFALPPLQAPSFRPSPGLFSISENATAINTDPVTQTAGYGNTMHRVASYSTAVTRSDPVVSNMSVMPTTSKHVGDFLPPRALAIERRSTTTQPAAVVSHLMQFEDELAEMNLLIPPRREYSFGRKALSPKSTANPLSREGPPSRPSTGPPPQSLSSRPSTGVPTPREPSQDNSRPSTGLPPLPQPTFEVSDTIENQSYVGISNTTGQGATKPTMRPSTSAGTMQIPAPTPTPKRAPSKKVAPRPSTAIPKTPVAVSSSSTAPHKAATIVVSSDYDPVMQVDSTSDVVHTVSRSSIDEHATRNEQLQSSLSKAAYALSDPSSVTIQGDDKENLGNYAALPFDERMRVIENMLIASVEDENFVKLCQDVSGCWQRIGFDA